MATGNIDAIKQPNSGIPVHIAVKLAHQVAKSQNENLHKRVEQLKDLLEQAGIQVPPEGESTE